MTDAMPTSESINQVISDLLGEFKVQYISSMKFTLRRLIQFFLFIYYWPKEILNKHLNARPPLYKESANTIQIIQFLANQMDPAQDDFTTHTDSIIEWLTQMAQKRPIEDLGVVKEILGLLIQLCEHSDKLDVIRDLAMDIHARQGEIDVDEDSQVEAEVNYEMVNQKTNGAATTLVLNYAEQENDGMTWCIGRLKLSGKTTAKKREEFEKKGVPSSHVYCYYSYFWGSGSSLSVWTSGMPTPDILCGHY